MSHDRFIESHYFLHEMLDKYHQPAPFRYSANAFLSALKSVSQMLQMELEPRGLSPWLREHRAAMDEDPILSAFFKGRDIVVHQRALFRSSEIEVGLFRDGTTKAAMQLEVGHDQPSEELLKGAVKQFVGKGKWLDKSHNEIGMQVGVRRKYRDSVVSPHTDVVTAAHLAWARVSDVVSAAHSQLGASYEPIPEDPGAHAVEHVDTLYETDLDPDAARRWGWLD